MQMMIIIMIFISIIFILFGIIVAYYGSNRNGNLDQLLKKHEARSDVMEKIEIERKKLPQLISKEYKIVNRDGFYLHGYLIKSKKPSNVYVFYSHGYRSPDGGMEFGSLMEMWEEHDYNFFIVDHRGHGKSEGSHISFGYCEAEDNMEWLTFMVQEFGENIQIILEGQSMGGAIVLMMSGKPLNDQVKFIISDCGYTSFYEEALWAFKFPFHRIIITIANIYLTIFHHINMKKASPITAVNTATKPILFMHGVKDEFVPMSMGKQNFEAYKGNVKEFHVFDAAEHATSAVVYPKEYMSYINNYINKYIS